MILFLYFPIDTEIRNGNLKAILGLFFSLSRYKQQQHHQQQYYQSQSFNNACHPRLPSSRSQPGQNPARYAVQVREGSGDV